jgi:hypothetical protein
MAEFKRVFSKAIMNKDMDERLVPNGQYRDANNIEISTSEASEVGTVQTVLGNTQRNQRVTSSSLVEQFSGGTMSTSNSTFAGPHNKSVVVGSIATPDTDKIYYMVAAGGFSDSPGEVVHTSSSRLVDYILEYDTIEKIHRYVFVDIYQNNHIVNGAVTNSTDIYVDDGAGAFGGSQTEYVRHARVGMRLVSNSDNISVDDDIRVTAVAYDASAAKYKITVSEAVSLSDDENISFVADRVLNFNKGTIITGINVIDDFLFWTDNEHEPKKINIPRSIAGTGKGSLGEILLDPVTTVFNGDSDAYHTRLVKDKSFYDTTDRYEIVTNAAGDYPVFVDESHVTVIRKAPTQPLELKMFRTSSARLNSDGEENSVITELLEQSFMNPEDTGSPLQPGSEIELNAFETAVDFREGDIILLTQQDSSYNQSYFENFSIRAEVIESSVDGPNQIFSSGFTIRILSISQEVDGNDLSWYARLEDTDPLFQFKFPRFSYRYKYQDGEYSTFAPFSQIAFLPDYYEYHPKKGYNLGMVNQLRGLQLQYYHYDENTIPADVVEIDLLYKEAGNPTVYTVKTLKRSDEDPVWPDLIQGDGDKRGSFDVTTDMIHAVVPANQILRPYDNVPRKALAQEISANRLIYGNYLQNYTILKDPDISVGVEQTKFIDLDSEYAYPSVKSMRKYQVGVVFSDKYGRETPVLTSKKSTVTLTKQASETRNRLTAQLNIKNNVIPTWAKYYSFYVKETSVEYYNLVQDRWYNAADGNIWLSFPSSERNKIDIDSYIKIKKRHGSDVAVKDKNKYKVLAIEGEAPEFIKTTKKVLGIFINANNNLIGNSEEGFPLQDTTFVDLNAGAFETAFGDDLLLDTPDRMEIVFRVGNNSASYRVSSIKGQGGSGGDYNHYRVNIDGKFDDDIAWITTDDTFNTRVDGISVELIELQVENKPEFDGRFFVKVFKDTALEINVLGNGAQLNMAVDKTKKVRYIANNGYSNQVIGEAVPIEARYWPQPTATIGSSFNEFNLDRHPTEYTHISEVEGEDVYYWGGTNGTTTIYPWDQNGVVGGTLGSYFLQKNPVYALNYSTTGMDFWMNFVGGLDQTELFFDACTAFSLTGSKIGSTNYTEAPGCTYNTIPGTFTTSGFAKPGTIVSTDIGAQANEWAALPFGGITNAFNAYKERKGEPSRGIWGPDNRYMDIAWSGIHGGINNTGAFNNIDEDEGVPHLVQQSDSGLMEGVADFMQQLCNPGTVFRFRNCPDEMQYTVVGTGFTPSPFGSSEYTYKAGVSTYTGVWGIRNFIGEDGTDYFQGNNGGNQKSQFLQQNLRQRWTIVVEPGIGSGPSGYIPTRGTKAVAQGGPGSGDPEFRRALHHDYTESDAIEILIPFTSSDSFTYTENPAVWETEPKESVELDIYYQASGLIPVELNEETNEEYIPIGSTFNLPSAGSGGGGTLHTVTGINDQTITFTPAISGLVTAPTSGSIIKFTKRSHYSMEAFVAETAVTGATTLVLHGGPTTVLANQKLTHQKQYLDWNNCWCFGNGVESDRVRDSFNAPQVDNGVKASAVLAEQVREERRKHGMIFSGIYNSTSGVNNLNQFIAAEPITKDLNPVYGSIQKLVNRNTRLVMFCEDKVLRADTNKDLLFNADGNSQVVASNKVIGAAVPYTSRYGVSTNPESVVVTPSNMYFTDVMRGKVLALGNQGDGIRVISDKGMKDYFSDLFDSYVDECLGTFDARKKDYNLTVKKKYAHYQAAPHESVTISYSESSDGWESFKSFIPQSGVSLNNSYYTMFDGMLFEHHINETRNNFYGTQYTSDITVLFNDEPTNVKSFTTINYEGSQANVPVFTDVDNNNYFTGDYSVGEGLVDTDNVTDGEYYNLTAKNGWYVDDMYTNLQSCGDIYFKNKEDKYFGFPSGETTVLTNLDEKEFTVQGIGLADITHSDNTRGDLVTLTFAVNASGTYVGSDGSGSAWDASSTSLIETNKFTHTSQTIQVEGGAAIGAQTIYVPITAIIDGVFSGYALSADNLEIDNATVVSESARLYSVDSDVNADGLAAGPFFTFQFFDSDANGVRETSIGATTSIPGSPNNIVYVGLVLQNTFVAPTSDTTYYFDVDEKASVLFAGNRRKACIRTDVDINNVSVEAAPVVADLSNITETTLLNTSHLLTRHSGDVNDNVSTEVARLTFTRAGTSYFAGGANSPYVQYANLGEYEGYYNDVIIPTYGTDVNGFSVITSFVVKIFYTPPTEGALANDPDDFCKLGHKAIIHRQIRTPDTVGLEDITGVDHDKDCPSIGGLKIISVHGKKGVSYKISVQKKTSLTSNTTAASGGFFNFETNKFQDDAYEQEGTIPDDGSKFTRSTKEHYLTLPQVTDDTRYDVVIDPNTPGAATPTVKSTVPLAAGQSIITQTGTARVDVEPETDNPSNFGDLTGSLQVLGIIRPKKFDKDKKYYGENPDDVIRRFVGGTGNVASKRIKLQRHDGRLVVGMYIANPFDNVAIPHKTTITKVEREAILVSNNCTIPDGTALIAFLPTTKNKPFSLTIPPGSGKRFTTLKNTNLSRLIPSTTRTIPTKINGAVASSTTVNLDTTEDLAVGMTMFDLDNLDPTTAVPPNVATVTVVNSATQITVDSAIVIADNTNVQFGYTASTGVTTHAIRTSLSDGNLMIEGYISSNSVGGDQKIPINLDNLVNVT